MRPESSPYRRACRGSLPGRRSASGRDGHPDNCRRSPATGCSRCWMARQEPRWSYCRWPTFCRTAPASRCPARRCGSSWRRSYAHTIGANWTHTFGPGTVMQAQFGRTWAIDNTTSAVPAAPSSIVSSLSPDFACNYPGDRPCLTPSVGLVSFLGTPGDTVTIQGASDIWSGQVNLSKLWRKHLFTMGFTLNTNNIGELILNNSLSFSPFQTADLQNPGKTGSDLASFLLGVPVGGTRRLQGGSENGGWVNGYYFGDQWKATDRLTVNWGLRYDTTLLTTWGAKSDKTIYVGSLNANNGTYIVQVPTPSCADTGK